MMELMKIIGVLSIVCFRELHRPGLCNSSGTAGNPGNLGNSGNYGTTGM